MSETADVSEREQGRREGWAAFRDTLKQRVWNMKNPCSISDVVALTNTHHASQFWKQEQNIE